MIINGDGGYSLLAADIGRPAAQADWLDPKIGGGIHHVNRVNSRNDSAMMTSSSSSSLFGMHHVSA